MQAIIEAFFDEATFTYSYVVSDPHSNRCAIIDPVLDYDPAAGKTSHDSANRIIGYVKSCGLGVDWILETHVHADHLSAARYLQEHLGGSTGIGAGVTAVQDVFGDFFNAEPDFARDGSQFDHLFEDDEPFRIGDLEGRVWHTPGHTPACVSYLLERAAFVGDTVFQPDYGTARTDFPGGDARTLFASIGRILSLPGATELYMCHDYGTETREDFCYLTTVAEERSRNVHLAAREGARSGPQTDEDTFVALREKRDSQLAAPRLLLPSVQFNMRGARLPPPEDNGVCYLKIPVRAA